MAHYIALSSAGGSFERRFYLWSISFIIAAVLCSTANGFLVAAIASLTRQDDAIDKVWKVRHVIDVSVALAVCLVPVQTG
jgi:hypothetical protein